MLVSHRKRFIYTKTAKTAGTSVEVYFEPYCLPEGEWQFSHAREEYVGESGIIGYRGKEPVGKKWYNHMSAELVREQLGPAMWDDYFKFCVIRNPFDKLVSAFHYALAVENELYRKKKLHARIIHRLQNVEYRTLKEQFRVWVEKERITNDRNKYVINGEICMDYFIKYEDLENGVRHVCQTLEIPFNAQLLPRLKSGTRLAGSNLRDYYSAKTIELVVNRFEFEFKHFGYPSELP